MKKFGIMALGLMMSLSLSAKNNDNTLESAKKQVVEQVQKAPQGTTWGVTAVTKDHVVVTSPFGRHTIACKDGTYSFMGITARVTSTKNGIVKVTTNFGKFAINTRKLTVTKL